MENVNWRYLQEIMREGIYDETINLKRHCSHCSQGFHNPGGKTGTYRDSYSCFLKEIMRSVPAVSVYRIKKWKTGNFPCLSRRGGHGGIPIHPRYWIPGRRHYSPKLSNHNRSCLSWCPQRTLRASGSGPTSWAWTTKDTTAITSSEIDTSATCP